MKNKDGSQREYLQLVESRRVNGQPRQIVLMTLGRTDTDDGRAKIRKITQALLKNNSEYTLLDPEKHLSCERAMEYGPLLIFKKLWNEMGFGEVIEEEMSKNDAEFSIVESIFNMVLNRVTEPCSKAQLELWQDDVYGLKKFESHQYYRALDYLIDNKESIEQGLYHRVRDLFSQSVDVVLFDTTTVVYFGEGDKGEDLLKQGFSKDKRFDLKQVVIGVLMSKEGIPLGYEVFPGNNNDVTCFKNIIEKVKDKFQLGKVILVGDRGMISQKNINYLEKNGYEYILGYRMRTIPKKDRSKVLNKAKLKKSSDTLEYREVKYEGQKLIICYNPERAEKDKEHREEIIEKLRVKLKSTKDPKGLVSNAHYKKFLKIYGSKPQIDEERVLQDAQYDGVYVITSNTKFSAQYIIHSYKDLWQVEQAFRQLKSELKVGPMYHWKDRRVRAHIMVCFISLVMRTVFYKSLQEEDENVSYPKVMRDLKSLQAIEQKILGSPITMRTELKTGASLAFKALRLKVPNRVLSESGNLSAVVVRQTH